MPISLEKMTELIEKAKQARDNYDPEEAARTHERLPELDMTPGSTAAIFFPTRPKKKDDEEEKGEGKEEEG